MYFIYIHFFMICASDADPDFVLQRAESSPPQRTLYLCDLFPDLHIPWHGLALTVYHRLEWCTIFPEQT